jgi:hypothetical protein
MLWMWHHRGWLIGTSISEEIAAFICRVKDEDGGSKFL